MRYALSRFMVILALAGCNGSRLYAPFKCHMIKQELHAPQSQAITQNASVLDRARLLREYHDYHCSQI